MKKTFDCIEMKNRIQEKMWIDAGESIEGLKKLLFDKKNNILYQEFMKRKEKERQLPTV